MRGFVGRVEREHALRGVHGSVEFAAARVRVGQAYEQPAQRLLRDAALLVQPPVELDVGLELEAVEKGSGGLLRGGVHLAQRGVVDIDRRRRSVRVQQRPVGLLRHCRVDGQMRRRGDDQALRVHGVELAAQHEQRLAQAQPRRVGLGPGPQQSGDRFARYRATTEQQIGKQRRRLALRRAYRSESVTGELEAAESGDAQHALCLARLLAF
ncbi:hypothetical protein GALL_322010 [mine drainage metagenome]|uniref:Uncharacterized protein n=1 Tax=mine drainage metagenome TaxID=410659 RepID=A0A1J5R1Z2_9ZZZZ